MAGVAPTDSVRGLTDAAPQDSTMTRHLIALSLIASTLIAPAARAAEAAPAADAPAAELEADAVGPLLRNLELGAGRTTMLVSNGFYTMRMGATHLGVGTTLPVWTPGSEFMVGVSPDLTLGYSPATLTTTALATAGAYYGASAGGTSSFGGGLGAGYEVGYASLAGILGGTYHAPVVAAELSVAPQRLTGDAESFIIDVEYARVIGLDDSVRVNSTLTVNLHLDGLLF